MTEREGVLVTAAATVGLRPLHGELWLFGDGVLYRRLGLRRTLAQLRKESGRRAPPQTVDPDDRPHRRFTPDELDGLVAAEENRWVARDQLRAARLRRRLTVTRLRLDLADDRCIVLSWPRRDQATPAVQAHLADWLGGSLEAD